MAASSTFAKHSALCTRYNEVSTGGKTELVKFVRDDVLQDCVRHPGDVIVLSALLICPCKQKPAAGRLFAPGMQSVESVLITVEMIIENENTSAKTFCRRFITQTEDG